MSDKEREARTKLEKYFMMCFAGIIVIFSFAYWTLITFFPVLNQRFADTLNGSLMTLDVMVIGYWFTASSSSDKKTEMLKSMADNQKQNP